MLRKLHSLPGLLFGLALMVLGASGAILALDPALERAQAHRDGTVTLGAFAASVQQAFPGVEQINRRANGEIVVIWSTEDAVGSDRIDPVTLAVLGEDPPSTVMTWVKSLHRSFLLDDIGRAAAGILAAVTLAMMIGGLALLARVQGGWRKCLRALRPAPGPGRLHMVVGRLAIGLLAVSAITGLWMSLATFELVDDGRSLSAQFPFEVAGTAPAPLNSLPALQEVPLDSLRRLTFPQPDDAQDVFGLQTADGSGYVDQATGALLNWLPHSPSRQVWEWAYALHTGQGLWWVGLALGVGGLALPVLAITGALIWARRMSNRPRLRNNARANAADAVILVGSEGGSTWAFAATLHAALHAAGLRVHTAAMNDVRPYPGAKHLFVLTATYGDGDAPASANRFLARVDGLVPLGVHTAVLGFGDRMYPNYCGFAAQISQRIDAQGWPVFHPLTMIDRQSVLDFASWGQSIGQAMGLPLVLDHRHQAPRTQKLRLVSRQDFGQAVQAPSVILRFKAETGGFWPWSKAGLPRFEAGDLLGILAPGTDLPRLYSLASSRADGWVELCVRKAAGGLCSGFLHGLQPGDTINAFVRPNPAFRPLAGKAPVIMVAAGCGIAPMAGFLRRLKSGRQVSLYVGNRTPEADYLYRDDLEQWQTEGRLARLITAFSRVKDRAYVQDRIHEDAIQLRNQIAKGGQVLVCGGVAMAKAVRTTFDAALAPIGQSVAQLKAEGRYLEDVY